MMADLGGMQNSENRVELYVGFILFLLVGLPLIFITIFISKRMKAYFFVGLFLLLLIPTLSLMAIQRYMTKNKLNKAKKLTIKQLIANMKRRNYGIITAKVKKMYLTREEKFNQDISNKIVKASRYGGLGSGYVISHFRNYLIDDGTKVVKLYNVPAYPKYSKGQQIVFLGKISYSNDKYYLIWLVEVSEED